MFGKDPEAGDNVRRLRIKRVQDLLARITDHAVLHRDGIHETELLSKFGLATGLTRRKVKEYLQDLLDAKLVRRDDGGFLWPAPPPPGGQENLLADRPVTQGGGA